jgi:alkylation response protein AidB-like acyl-CoA dehydrogenase
MACYQAVAAIAMLGPSAGLSRALLAELLLGDGCPRDPATGPELALVTPAFASHATMKEPTFEGRVPQVRATREGGGWLLEAREARPLHAGGTASLFAVICSVEGEEPGLFLVPSGAPGLDRGARLRQAGLTGSPNAAISFSGVRLQDENRVCAGREALRALFTWLRLLTAAGAVGGLAAAHSILADWGEHRVIKGLGQVFKENPLTASLMTDLAARLCWGRLLVHDLAHFLAHPEAYGPAGADPLHSTGVSVFGAVMASAEIALGQAMELMASAGYAREWFLERYWRDLKCVRGLLGGSMLSRLQLARHAYGCETL